MILCIVGVHYEMAASTTVDGFIYVDMNSTSINGHKYAKIGVSTWVLVFY